MKSKYPPGPRNWNSLIGLTWRHAFCLWMNPLKFATKMGRTYGDIAFCRFFMYRAYFVNHPDLIHEVLVTKAKSFRKQRRQMGIMRQMVGNGLVVSEGGLWSRQRRLLQPAFHSRRMETYAQNTVRHTERMLDQWTNQPEVRIADEMTRLTISITAKSLFDVELSSESTRLGEAISKVTKAMMEEIANPFTPPDWFPLPSKRRKRWAIETFDSLIHDIIRQRRASGEDKGDLLSMLLLAVDEEGNGTGMTDQQARDEAITLFHAGYHAASMSLAWTWYLIAKHPEVQARLAEEIETVLGDRAASLEDLPKLRYTEMVIKESLRLYPPAWSLFARETVEDVELSGYTIPKGSWTFIYPFVTHRDPRFFEDPERFVPERFAPGNEERIPQNAYFPFGLGPHVCIGNRMAMMEMKLIVPTVLQRFRLALAADQGEVVPEPLLAIRPKGDIRITLSRRPISALAGAP